MAWKAKYWLLKKVRITDITCSEKLTYYALFVWKASKGHIMINTGQYLMLVIIVINYNDKAILKNFQIF